MARKIGVRKGGTSLRADLFLIPAKPFAKNQVLIENEIVCSLVARELRPTKRGCMPNTPGFHLRR